MFSELNGTMNSASSGFFFQQPTAWWPPDFSVKTPGTASPFSTCPGASCWSLRTPWSGSRCPRERFSTRAAASCGGAHSCSQTWWRPAGSSWPTQPSARRPAWRWSTESTDRNRRSPWTLWSRWRCCWSSEVLIHLFISFLSCGKVLTLQLETRLSSLMGNMSSLLNDFSHYGTRRTKLRNWKSTFLISCLCFSRIWRTSTGQRQFKDLVLHPKKPKPSSSFRPVRLLSSAVWAEMSEYFSADCLMVIYFCFRTKTGVKLSANLVLFQLFFSVTGHFLVF